MISIPVRVIWTLILLAISKDALAENDPLGYQPVPKIALLGEDVFDKLAAAKGNTSDGMSASMQSNPLQFPTLTDFWCAWELTDRKRVPALLVDDMQVEYEPYVKGILPQTKLLVEAFRKAGLPIFWSTWWRWGPDDGFFNTMDRFYGPIGWRTAGNALYNHQTNGGDVLSDIGPINDEERKRVMHKSYSLDMFDDHPMNWLVPSGQGTLDTELQKLGVDTVVQVGAWTDDCIISTAFHAFSLQYDVVMIEDGVSTASKQHFNAVEVIRGAAAKVLFAQDVADYINGGLQVIEPTVAAGKLAGGRAGREGRAPAPSRIQPKAHTMMYSAQLIPPASSLSGYEFLILLLLALVGPGGLLLGFAAGWALRGRSMRVAPADHFFNLV